jgi:hypothetical protein
MRRHRLMHLATAAEADALGFDAVFDEDAVLAADLDRREIESPRLGLADAQMIGGVSSACRQEKHEPDNGSFHESPSPKLVIARSP